MSRRFGRKTVAVAALITGAIALAGCGGSSNKSSAYTGSTSANSGSSGNSASGGGGGAASTTAASGPLTKATLTALAPSIASATESFNAGASGTDTKATAAAAATYLTALRTYTAQISALKPPSAAVAAEQQKYVSALTQTAALVDQFGKAASANNISAAKALLSQAEAAVSQQVKATGAALLAAAP